MNEAWMNCFVDINGPVSASSIEQFMTSAEDMTSSVNPAYNKYLDKNIQMFVISASLHDRIDPADGYHVSFKEQHKCETVMFSQFYE
ncbi:12627_t:CDS:2 [Entrophospora sp. SA101]|nr:1298_t:CDS:2 [Entrophospora sp. SA101]CAJ0744923.1 13859_t:CDS:2 [Entrophospora sp. SA101]CAJ0767973.1 12627_t:CDS:2 [Entrophospora sp. SA101]CAJ0824882.1 11879_t:CDS:2 [Entrophospora sp. SA101]